LHTGAAIAETYGSPSFELRPPVAERFERNPLSLAILSLIQLTPTPGLMVCSPERYPVARAVQQLVRLVLLTCKIAVRTDRVWGTREQVCEKWTLTMSSTKFPVRSKTFPVSVQKFPVPLRREFSRKPLNSLADWTRKSRGRVGIRKIPC
jgi:hypothetical protein